MSAGAHASVVPELRRRPARVRAAEPAGRPALRLVAFGALGLYGVLRWGTLITPVPAGRLLGLLALAVLVVGIAPRLNPRRWPLGVAGAVLALAAMLPICGVPLAWVTHVRIAVIASGISQGLSSLPAVLLPYAGINQWTHVVMLLGAGVLLLDGALSLAFAGPAPSDLRRAGAALPLVALAMVPSTLLHPRHPYLQGVLLFGLLAAFLWGERIAPRDRPAVVALCVLAAAGAMILAPSLERHKPWVNYYALAGSLSASGIDSFDWSQTYGPISWPRKGHEVLDVAARQPDYWKAENLDVFDGTAWVAGGTSQIAATDGVDQSAIARWTQTLQVTVRAMRINTLLAAGAASRPTDVPGLVVQGASPGTWIASNALNSGVSYRVSVYTPHPSPSELAQAGDSYPQEMGGYRTIELGVPTGRPRTGVRFPPFHSGLPVMSGLFLTDPNGAEVMRSSPYAQAYEEAVRLADHAATPYAFVESVKRHLATGYAYDENPPQSSYPLETFLFGSKLGYCQQFAGAMALLVRMGGVPARVAAGFTTGTYNRTTHQWVVSDLDAHAWVEVWFPHYGWVRFDPTPGADPALGGRAPSTSAGALGQSAQVPPPVGGKHAKAAPEASGGAVKRGGGDSSTLVIGIVVAVLAALGAALAGWRAGAPRDGEELLAELERAMARTGRPIGGGMTLATLERRVRGRPDAQRYIRTLRLARFAGRGELPTLADRRALRAELRSGLGLAGALRALWALPPRWSRPRGVSGADRGA